MDNMGEQSWPLKDIKDPSDNDVLCGRGGGTNNHPGNKCFREMVECRTLDYINARSNHDKYVLTMDIVFQIRGLKPPGRFITQDKHSHLWHDIGDKNARLKTSQAFRENAPVLKKKLEEFEHQTEESTPPYPKEVHFNPDDNEEKDDPPRRITCKKKMDDSARTEAIKPKTLVDLPIHHSPNQQPNNDVSMGEIESQAAKLDPRINLNKEDLSELNSHPDSTYPMHPKKPKEPKKDSLEEHDKKDRGNPPRKTRHKDLPCSFYKAFAQMTSVRSIRLNDYDIDPSINRNIDPYNDLSIDCITGPFGCSRRDLYNDASIGSFPTESTRNESELFNSAIDFEFEPQNPRSNTNIRDTSTSKDENGNPHVLSRKKIYRKISMKSPSSSESSLKVMKNNGESYATSIQSSMQSFPMDISGLSFNRTLSRSFSFHRSMSTTNHENDASMSTFDVQSNPSILSIASSVFSTSNRRFSMDV